MYRGGFSYEEVRLVPVKMASNKKIVLILPWALLKV